MCTAIYMREKKSGQIKIKNISAIKEKNVYVKISLRTHVSTQWHIEGMQCCTCINYWNLITSCAP